MPPRHSSTTFRGIRPAALPSPDLEVAPGLTVSLAREATPLSRGVGESDSLKVAHLTLALTSTTVCQDPRADISKLRGTGQNATDRPPIVGEHGRFVGQRTLDA